MNAKLSVIIPMYNSRNTIISALDSIHMQTRFDVIYEIIVIDDGSMDDSLNVVEDYKKTYPEMPLKIIAKENGGASSARNAGMRIASGDWFAFLDSDDMWLPEKTKRQMEILAAMPEIDFLGAESHGGDLYILWRHITELYKANIKDLALKFFPVTPSVLMKRKIYDEIGGFDERQHFAEDGNYFMKICLQYNYYYLPEQLVSIGHGKRPFGESGLSADLKGMHRGTIKNIKEFYNVGAFCFAFYIFLRVFYFVKYIRRIIITKFYRWRENGRLRNPSS